MGLLSNFATTSGLFGADPSAADLTPQSSSPDITALLGRLGIGAASSGTGAGGGLLPDLSASPPAFGQGAPMDQGQGQPQGAASPLMQGQSEQGRLAAASPPPSYGAPQASGSGGNGPSAPPMQSSGPSAPGAPAQFAPPQLQPHSNNVLHTIGDGLGNLIKLPFNIINGYAAAAADIPDRIKFEEAQRAYALRSGQMNQALIGSLLGGGGGLFGGGTPQSGPSAMPPAAPGLLGGPQAPVAGGYGAQGVPPTPASPINIPQGAPAGPTGLNIRDPRTQRTLAALDLLGNPAGKSLADLGIATMPKFSAMRPGSAPMNEATGQVSGPTLPQDGTQNIPNGDGTFTNVPVTGALANSAAMTAGQDAAKATVAQLYGPKTAGLTAAATNAADAPYKMVTIPMADGSTRTMPQSVYMAGIGGKGGVAAANAGFGSSQAPAAAQYATDQSKALSDVITQDQAGRQPAMIARDNGLRAATIASNTKFNPAAPLRYQAEKIATVLGIPSQDADKVATYQQLANQSLLQFAKSNLPSRYTERELNFTKTIYGQIHDPNSAALIMAGTQAAVANKAIARADYASNYNPASGMTRQQYEAGWAKTPAGQQSIYQDPVFQGIKIGGKPAVMPFTAKGKSYLAVTPGLGKPTFIPAY